MIFFTRIPSSLSSVLFPSCAGIKIWDVSKTKGLESTTDKLQKGAKGSNKTKSNPIVDWINSWKTMSKKGLANFTLAVGVLIISLPLLALGLKQFAGVDWKSALIIP